MMTGLVGRLPQYLRTVWFWCSGLLITFMICLTCGLVYAWLVLTGKPRDGRPVHRVATLWGHLIFWVTPSWKIRVEGREHLPQDGTPAVLVANHESMTDIFAMYYLGVQFRWLAKEEAFRIPLVGHAMAWCDYVRVDRGDKDSHARAMEAAADRLRKGVAMFFFPEGTRSPDGRIKEFKSGAFKLARDAQVPVVPLLIFGARELLPKGGLIPGKATVVLKVLPALPPPPRQAEAFQEYIADVRASIVRERDYLAAMTQADGR